MLNVLLYFADVFAERPEEAIRVYFLGVLEKEMGVNMVAEILYEERILEVCGI